MSAETVSLFDPPDELTRLRDRLRLHFLAVDWRDPRGLKLTADEFAETLERVVRLAHPENQTGETP